VLFAALPEGVRPATTRSQTVMGLCQTIFYAFLFAVWKKSLCFCGLEIQQISCHFCLLKLTAFSSPPLPHIQTTRGRQQAKRMAQFGNDGVLLQAEA